MKLTLVFLFMAKAGLQAIHLYQKMTAAVKKYTHRMKGVAAFSDDIRDGLKGSVFDAPDRGFASGKPYMEESVKFGVVAATQHPQINYEKVNYSNEPWAAQPNQAISYLSCHDNHTLWDRLINSQPDANETERIKMAILANTVVLNFPRHSFFTCRRRNAANKRWRREFL